MSNTAAPENIVRKNLQVAPMATHMRMNALDQLGIDLVHVLKD